MFTNHKAEYIYENKVEDGSRDRENITRLIIK